MSVGSAIRKMVIAANWKSYGNVSGTQGLVTNVLNKIVYNPEKIDLLVQPPSIFIPLVMNLLTNKHIHLCAQNHSYYGPGAYTGEVSAIQLKDLGLQWSMVGHSERRSYFNEAIDVVANKVKMGVDQGLNVILCLGENFMERKDELTFSVCQATLNAVKGKITLPQWEKLVVHYEPVWAIGTGKVASPEEVQEVHEMIREWLIDNISPEVSARTRIIYGGSVNEHNFEKLIEQKDVDGFLIGRASLTSAFKTIVEGCNSVNKLL